MMAKRFSLLVAAVTMFAACAGPANFSPRSVAQTSVLKPAGNLIQNGSFEQPIVPSGSFTLFSTGQTFAHWKVVGVSGNVGVVSGAFLYGGDSFPAGCGQQWLDLTGTSNSATGVAQKIETVKGTNYLLSFKVGNAVGVGGSTSSTVKVHLDGKLIFSAKNSRGKGVMHQVWEAFHTSFKAPSAETTLSFINGDPPTDTDNGLDCVSLVAGSRSRLR
jgi:Protein of unknown function (DUF642)